MDKELNEKYLKRMIECNNYEAEYGHIDADNILCELLTELGYKDIVEVFEKLDKWYS